MPIPVADYQIIQNINVNLFYVHINYNNWFNEFPAGHYLHNHINIVFNTLGANFNRSDLVRFYADPQINNVTKFLSAIIWGYAAPQGGRPANFGPHRVSKMFQNPHASAIAINSVNIATNAQIENSYNSLNAALPKCGPNFFTKHFYFLGKSSGMNQYPIIFDDRVAAGLVKVEVPPVNRGPLFDMVRVSAVRKPAEYINYLTYAQNQAALINCDLDQIEYYLFTL